MTDPKKRAEKKAKIKALQQQLKQMTPAQREALALELGLLKIDGGSYSVYNQIMIHFQAGDLTPSILGGFRQWKKAGRHVKKGQHGFTIFYPANKGKKSNELDAEEKPRFFTGTVFDISQTAELEPATA